MVGPLAGPKSTGVEGIAVVCLVGMYVGEWEDDGLVGKARRVWEDATWRNYLGGMWRKTERD